MDNHEILCLVGRMKILSWNVNGLRAVLGKGFLEFLCDEDPDILCLQEVKAWPEQINVDFPEPYSAHWNPAKKKGYSGTLTLSKPDPLSASEGMKLAKHDDEGRIVTTEHEAFYLVNVYTPNSQNELRRLDYRTREWDVDFLAYLRKLEKTKPVIFCGDLNVAHKEIDLARPAPNKRNPGFTEEERAGLDKVVEAGFIDTFREFNQEPHQYSWWSYRAGARGKNVGWRLDYFWISPALRPKLKKAFILPEITGSDHCPVGIEIDL
jgi:exodeoxyribonuclease III